MRFVLSIFDATHTQNDKDSISEKRRLRGLTSDMAEVQRAEQSLFRASGFSCTGLNGRFLVQREVRGDTEVENREEIGVAEFEAVRRESVAETEIRSYFITLQTVQRGEKC